MTELVTENKPQEPIVQQVNSEPQKEQENIQQPILSEEENDKQINWKKWKESRAKERAEAEQIRKRAEEKEREAEALKAAMESLLNKPVQQNNQFNEDETEDERIEKKVQAALLKAEEKRIQQQQQREIEELPQMLVRNNPDFHQVCTSENMDYLEYHYPEVAAAFSHMPEGYKKWENIYKAVKRFVPNLDSKKETAKIEKNFNKPQSISSPSVNQTRSDPAPLFLSEDRRAANWARMQKILNSID